MGPRGRQRGHLADVTVAVDEAGQDRLAMELDDVSFGAPDNLRSRPQSPRRRGHPAGFVRFWFAASNASSASVLRTVV